MMENTITLTQMEQAIELLARSGQLPTSLLVSRETSKKLHSLDNSYSMLGESTSQFMKENLMRLQATNLQGVSGLVSRYVTEHKQL